MYISAIMHPDVMDAHLFEEDASHYNYLLDFLSDIYDRGILLFDDQDVISKALQVRLKILPPKYNRLRQFLEDVGKAGKRVYLPIEPGAGYGFRLVYKYKPDIFLSSTKHNNIESATPHNYKTMLNDDIVKKIRTSSEKSYQTTPLMLSENLDKEIVRDAIGRCIKYSLHMSINDKHIGVLKKVGSTNIESFYRGIKYITEIWEECCVIDGKKTLDINTTCGQDKDFLSAFEAKKRLDENLVNRLSEEFPHVQISLAFHSDSKKEYHYRSLISKYAKVQFDYGFDLFRKTGKKGQERYFLKKNPIYRHTEYDPGYFRSETKMSFADSSS